MHRVWQKASVKKFSFPYESVMTWRDMCAERERSVLEKLHAVRSSLDKAQEQLQTQIEESFSDSASGASTSAEELRYRAMYVGSLQKRQKTISAQQATCGNQIQHQTGKCREADRDHELLIRLRKQSLNSWHYQANKETEELAAENWLATHGRNLSA